MVVVVGSHKDYGSAVETANQLVRLNQSRVCLLHGGVEALRTAGLLELPPRGAAQQ